MRKLKLQVQISIDGFIAGPNGEMDWMEWNWGEDINNYVTAITEGVDTILLGRKLAEGFIPYWADAAQKEEKIPGADIMDKTPKVVFTNTLTTHNWERTTLAHDPEKDIPALKAATGGDLIAYGGAGFVSSLIKAGLIDEYYLLVNPTSIGKGMPIFAELTDKKTFKLADATAFDCGIAALYYQKI